METLYGETRFELKNGFSEIQIQDRVWTPRIDNSEPIAQNDKVNNFYDDLLRSSQAGEDLRLISGSSFNSASSIFAEAQNANSIVLNTGTKTQQEEIIPGLYFRHSVANTNQDPNTIVHLNSTTIVLERFQIGNNMNELNENPRTGNVNYSFLSFGALKEDQVDIPTVETFCIDKQGHIANEKLISYELLPFEILPNSYRHDDWVQHLACGPESVDNSPLATYPLSSNNEQFYYTSTELKKLNSTSVRVGEDENHNPIYTTTCGNFIDLYQIITPLYHELVSIGNENFLQDLEDKCDELWGKMNGNNLDLQDAPAAERNFYLFNPHYTLSSTASLGNKMVQWLDQMEYEQDELDPMLYILPTGALGDTPFLTTIETIRQYQKGDSLSKKWQSLFEHFDDFFILMRYILKFISSPDGTFDLNSGNQEISQFLNTAVTENVSSKLITFLNQKMNILENNLGG